MLKILKGNIDIPAGPTGSPEENNTLITLILLGGKPTYFVIICHNMAPPNARNSPPKWVQQRGKKQSLISLTPSPLTLMTQYMDGTSITLPLSEWKAGFPNIYALVLQIYLDKSLFCFSTNEGTAGAVDKADQKLL
jgi:hypothetical protein